MTTDYAELCSTHACGDCYRCNLTRAQSALATAEALALTNGVEAEQGRRNEASIKGQLRVVATAYFGPLGDLTAEQYLAKLENGLASAMQRQQESYERAEQIDAALAAAAGPCEACAPIVESFEAAKATSLAAYHLAHPAAAPAPEGTPTK